MGAAQTGLCPFKPLVTGSNPVALIRSEGFRDQDFLYLLVLFIREKCVQVFAHSALSWYTACSDSRYSTILPDRCYDIVCDRI
jgi:hypothetical protein